MHADDRARAIEHGFALVVQVAHTPVGADDPVVHHERLRPDEKGLVDLAPEARAVVRVQEGLEPRLVERPALETQAENAVGLVGPVFESVVAGELVFPMAEVGDALGRTQPALATLECLRSFAPLAPRGRFPQRAFDGGGELPKFILRDEVVGTALHERDGGRFVRFARDHEKGNILPAGLHDFEGRECAKRRELESADDYVPVAALKLRPQGRCITRPFGGDGKAAVGEVLKGYLSIGEGIFHQQHSKWERHSDYSNPGGASPERGLRAVVGFVFISASRVTGGAQESLGHRVCMA